MALVHIYCGDGKGKTSAAVGMAVRAAGRGLKVVMVRFLKSDDSGRWPYWAIFQGSRCFLVKRPSALYHPWIGRPGSGQPGGIWNSFLGWWSWRREQTFDPG